MYISLNWLKDFIKIPAPIKAATVAAELTEHTVEVENFVSQAERFAQVVVGRVLEVKPHPNADRLRLVVVDVKTEKLNIVCGALNVAAGQLVPVALVGAVLPNGLGIKATEIRGAKSHGMLCAEDELGLGESQAGIMILSAKAKVGESFAKYLKAEDVILEVDNKSLSNRPDLLCHYGLARELSVIFSLDLKPYDKFLNKFEWPAGRDSALAVKVEERELCPRYQAVKIENITVKESPSWLKERLVAAQQRPINNIVDLANYVMLEIGQPLHAFDAAKVKQITVRRAAADEIIETLDGQERTLTSGDLVIAAGREAVAIAGVMGGKDSGVSPATKTIILEAANFQAAAIRRTAQRLGLRTESSLRFEKSLDPELTEVAVRRFLTLLKKVCPSMKIASVLTDIKAIATEQLVIDLDLSWLNAKLGQAVPREQVINILEKLGFTIADKAAATLAVAVPSWRATKDVRAKEDLVEEILRFYGYDKIAAQLPAETLRVPESNQERTLERKIKNILALQAALAEVYNYSFVGADQLTKLHIDFSNYLPIANPLSEVQTHLRQSLAPGLITNVRNNQAKADRLAFFELGSVFFNTSGHWPKETGSDQTLPHQEKRLALILADEDANLFGRVKGAVSGLLQNLLGGQTEIEFAEPEVVPGWAEPGVTAKILALGREIGLVALVGMAAGAGLNLKKSAALAEINFNLLLDLFLSRPSVRFQEAPKYPPVRRDLAIVVPEKILYNKVRKTITEFDPLIKSAELFDVYSGHKLKPDEKSLAFHLAYQSEEKTLTAATIDRLEAGLLEHLGKTLGAKLRGF
jgi:phenylalanyl-tRNA synthetase beta chain